MKVDNERKIPAAQPRTDFKQTLRTVAKPLLADKPSLLTKPLALAGQTVFADARAHANRVAEGLSTARATMEVKVDKAQEVRSDGVTANEKKVEAKVLDLIARELKEDRLDAPTAAAQTAPDDKPAQVAHFQRGADGKSPALGGAKVDSILELVDRIRVFEKAGRPAMALTVGGTLNAEVEIERAGPKLVSIKIVGKGKLPSASGLDAIRAELARSGIKVGALSISVR